MRLLNSSLTSLALILAGSVPALADDVTIPNVFQAGTPARAAEVNANFSAVESSVDDNAQDIAANVSEISNVSTGVDTNTQDIDTVANLLLR